ncbi:NUDIX hydrolase [Promicromonospora sukumoe]|uniref:NUDIX hydrolase n=1 Tax=Promicromonospora sukumoe TaxID=88382 RepID=UPI0037CA06CD
MPVSPYILGLRQHIGTDLLWLPGVTAVVLDDDGRVLLGQRSDNGRWALVSGILEPGEEPGVGIAREVLEETAVSVRVEALAAVTVTEQAAYPNGDRAQYLDLCFVCRPASPEAAAGARVNDDESLAVGWFAPDALPDGLHPDTVRRLELTLAYLADPAAGPHFAR